MPLFYEKYHKLKIFLQESQIFLARIADFLYLCSGFKIIMPEGKKMQHFHPQHSLVVGGNAMPLEDFFNGDIESLL